MPGQEEIKTVITRKPTSPPVFHRLLKTMLSSVSGMGTQIIVENVYDHLFITKRTETTEEV